MKLITSILIAWIITLFWLMNQEWYFWWVSINYIDSYWIFDLDISFIKNILDYFLYIPELIIKSDVENIKNIFSEYASLSFRDAYVLVIFLYNLVLIYIVSLLLILFPLKKDKRYLTIWLFIIYLLFIYIIKI